MSRQKLEWEILRPVQEGAKEFGIEPRADFQNGSNEGLGFFEVNQRNGMRRNTAKGFLRPAMRRPNLRVMTHAETQQVVIDGWQVTGVRFRRKGRVHEAGAKPEALFAAGAINSPKLLDFRA